MRVHHVKRSDLLARLSFCNNRGTSTLCLSIAECQDPTCPHFLAQMRGHSALHLTCGHCRPTKAILAAFDLDHIDSWTSRCPIAMSMASGRRPPTSLSCLCTKAIPTETLIPDLGYDAPYSRPPSPLPPDIYEYNMLYVNSHVVAGAVSCSSKVLALRGSHRRHISFPPYSYSFVYIHHASPSICDSASAPN